MELYIVGAIAIFILLVGYAVGRASKEADMPVFSDNWGMGEISALKSQLDYERTVSNQLRQEIQYINYNCRYRHQPPFHGACCCLTVHEPKIYMPSIKEQELVDLITKGRKSAEQLAKDLKI